MVFAEAPLQFDFMRVLIRSRMLADVEYFNSRISKLEGAGDLGEHLINTVQAKPIVSEPGAAQRPSTEKPQDEKPPPALAAAAAAAASSTETT